MGWFSKLWRKGAAVTRPQECDEVLAFGRAAGSLLGENRYIAQSDCAQVKASCAEACAQLGFIRSSGMLAEYCRKSQVDKAVVASALDTFENLEGLVNCHNEAYLASALQEEKVYLDGILREVDPEILLDEDQRRVVLTDENYCLVIAGAGAGKTTTVAAKVRYLVERKQVDPKQILIISFTHKAVDELREKINRGLKLDCPVTTFHAAGNAILRKELPEKPQIVDSGRLYYVVQDYFKRSILQNESLVNNLILFFGAYFDAPYEGDDLNAFFNQIAKANYSTLKSDLQEYTQVIIDRKTRRKVTISNEVLRSFEEVEIANFLYLNNIDYMYEPLYPFNIQYAKKPYTPDFLIVQGEKKAYIEHFGITESGKNNRYSDEQLDAYKKAINDKVRLHREKGTSLIYTFSKYSDNRSLLEHLRKELEKNGFALNQRPAKEVMEKLISTEENRYIRKLVNLICRFIANFKTNGFTAEEFSRMYHSTQNVRSRLFLNICNECYLEYQRYLSENHKVDFEDMINESARILREVKDIGERLDFSHIIVDEYQDISRQRFDLTTALAEVTHAKIIAVGDDWQSIYGFSGSDIELFTRFTEKMGSGKLLKIVRTYRNSQEVIDIAGNFIQKNDMQIKKELKSPKTITDPVIIYTYDAIRKKQGEGAKSGANFAMASAANAALGQIAAYNQAEGKNGPSSVLLLGRFGFDGDMLERSGLFTYTSRGNRLQSNQYPQLRITFMTAHASKGLGYDNVIVINGKNETYGFPSKIEDDPVLAFVIKGDRSLDYAEERRLFYVAMTRTKNRVYFIAPEQNPSEFLLEIKRDYKNVVLKGEWNEDKPQNAAFQKTCPICGYPLHFRYKNSYGLRMYICTNEPEVCGFLSNDLRGERLSIIKCGECTDGYLIVRCAGNDKNRVFLGCTNHKNGSPGCTNTMSKRAYYSMFDL